MTNEDLKYKMIQEIQRCGYNITRWHHIEFLDYSDDLERILVKYLFLYQGSRIEDTLILLSKPRNIYASYAIYEYEQLLPYKDVSRKTGAIRFRCIETLIQIDNKELIYKFIEYLNDKNYTDFIGSIGPYLIKKGYKEMVINKTIEIFNENYIQESKNVLISYFYGECNLFDFTANSLYLVARSVTDKRFIPYLEQIANDKIPEISSDVKKLLKTKRYQKLMIGN